MLTTSQNQSRAAYSSITTSFPRNSGVATAFLANDPFFLLLRLRGLPGMLTDAVRRRLTPATGADNPIESRVAATLPFHIIPIPA